MTAGAAGPRFIVGIDLGTTNTVIAYADSARSHATDAGVLSDQSRPQIELFRVPQLVAPGEVEPRELLPSFRYHPAEGELPEAELSVGFAEPLPALPRGVNGTLAQALGAKVPGRLIASAKSWLCHPAIDRTASVLPWGAPEGVAKLSPIDASASYLAHLRAAWDAAHPQHLLAEQEVVLTVPASFDEAARALTLEASRRAGLPSVRLLEEPQAAFYDWLDRHRDSLATDLQGVRLALVVDVGGGTTDLSLIAVELRESGPRLTRIAVGDHLMLGGDNMDVTLARLCEPRLVAESGSDARLPATRFAQLVQQCRQAKETLLGERAPEHVAVTLLGGGSKLIGGQTSVSLSRAQVEASVVDGFFPLVALDAHPEARRSGLVEFGLPYAADPVISKHIAHFLTRHRSEAAEALQIAPAQAELEPQRVLPDAVLWNGGVFRADALARRLHEVLAQLRGAPLNQLDNPEPEVAVARGAVAYGLARRGVGLKIGGGSPRSYYLLVESQPGTQGAMCVLPRGTEEGEEHALRGRSFALRVGKPVRFRVVSSTSERPHKTGELITLSPEGEHSYLALPEIAAVIEGKPGDREELPVELHAQLTEVGTLEMSLVSIADPTRRYQLEFQLRREQGAGSSVAPARVSPLHPRFREAAELLQIYYGKSNKQHEERKLRTLRPDLEKILGDRERWDTPLLRELFGELFAGSKRRRRSADHERLWFHFIGYTLRPGFGYPVDEWRVEQLWNLHGEGVQFAADAPVWAQWWIMWRRIAGGLDEAKQGQLLAELAFYLEPPNQRAKRPRPKGPRAQALEDMVRLAGSLERVAPERKQELGQWLLARLHKRELSPASVYWSLGRLGARSPWHGSAHEVIPAHDAARWAELLLALDLGRTEQAAFALTQISRFTNDRARDLPAELRERVARALARLPGSEAWVGLVREGGELSALDAERVLGDSLPPGLRLL
jgi:molecular chaperone DnaK (HSP70)